MNKLCALFFLVACCVFVGGCSEEYSCPDHPSDNVSAVPVDHSSEYYVPGVIWVSYDISISKQMYQAVEDTVPIPAVNRFLISRGYAPTVLETYYSMTGVGIEVIYVGSGVDISYLFGEMLALPDVAAVDLKISADAISTHPPTQN